MNKWKFRDGEIQLAEFVKLPSKTKQEHIKILLDMESTELSSNDQYILLQYGPKKAIKKFFNLSEEDGSSI